MKATKKNHKAGTDTLFNSLSNKELVDRIQDERDRDVEIKVQDISKVKPSGSYEWKSMLMGLLGAVVLSLGIFMYYQIRPSSIKKQQDLTIQLKEESANKNTEVNSLDNIQTLNPEYKP